MQKTRRGQRNGASPRPVAAAADTGQIAEITAPTLQPPQAPPSAAGLSIKSIVNYGLPLALAAATVFGIAGYAVGRAYLEGWYEGAGVSSLTFSWELQYVVLRGLSIDVLKFWMLLLFISAGAIIVFSAFSAMAEWLLTRKGKSKEQDSPSQTAPNSRPYFRKFVNSVAIALSLGCAAGLWFFGAQLLQAPKQQGGDDFKKLFASATCVSTTGLTQPVICIREGEQLGMYPWVEVRSPAFGATTRGWLLQQQGSTLLLLSRSGVDVVTLGDTPFSVSNTFLSARPITPEELRASAATYPKFKPEAEVSSPPSPKPVVTDHQASAAQAATPPASSGSKQLAASQPRSM
jgi:hypothetical protein